MKNSTIILLALALSANSPVCSQSEEITKNIAIISLFAAGSVLFLKGSFMAIDAHDLNINIGFSKEVEHQLLYDCDKGGCDEYNEKDRIWNKISDTENIKKRLRIYQSRTDAKYLNEDIINRFFYENITSQRLLDRVTQEANRHTQPQGYTKPFWLTSLGVMMLGISSYYISNDDKILVNMLQFLKK